MEVAKEIYALIFPATKLNHDKISSYMKQKLYREMIGYFLYLTVSRLDIVFSVELWAKFQANLKGISF